MTDEPLSEPPAEEGNDQEVREGDQPVPVGDDDLSNAPDPDPDPNDDPDPEENGGA